MERNARVTPITDLKGYSNWLSWEYWMGEWVREPGLKVADHTTFKHASFFGNERSRILTYDSTQTRHLCVPFISSDISVCFSWHMWATHLGYVLYSVIGTIFLAEFFYPDSDMGEEGKVIPACGKNAMGVSLNVNMCKFEDSLLSNKTEFRFLIAFILAGYVGMSVSTWKERRTDYASLCGNTRNLLLNIGSLFPDKCSFSDTPKETCSRWALLAFELAVLKSRGHMDSPQGRQYLEEAGVLKPGEWDLLANGDRHSASLYWLQVCVYVCVVCVAL